MRSPSAWGPVGGGGGRSLGMIGSYMFSSEPRGENSGHSSYFSPVDPEDVDSPDTMEGSSPTEIVLRRFKVPPVMEVISTGPEISEGSIFLVCSSPPLSVIDLVRFTEEEGLGGARDFLLPPSLRKLLRLAARGSSIFSGVGVSTAASFFSSFGSAVSLV